MGVGFQLCSRLLRPSLWLLIDLIIIDLLLRLVQKKTVIVTQQTKCVVTVSNVHQINRTSQQNEVTFVVDVLKKWLA